ncbi:MAG: hypothetical protein ACI89J_004511, partial [Hyphomicrobiaceae bacterium]
MVCAGLDPLPSSADVVLTDAAAVNVDRYVGDLARIRQTGN